MLKKILLSLLFTISAIAANWSAPFNVSSPSATFIGSDEPQVAVDKNGNSVAVWIEGGFVTRSYIQAATLAFGSTTWTTPVNLTPTTSGNYAYNPQVAVDPQGNAVAVWEFTDTIIDVVQAATLPFGATTWIPASASLSSPDAVKAFQPQVAVDCAGNAVAVWIFKKDNTAPEVIQAATLLAGTNTWIPASADLSSNPSGNALEPQVAMNCHGNAVAIWRILDLSNNTSSIQASTFSFASQTWTPTSDLVPKAGIVASQPDVAIDNYGNAVAVWVYFDSINNNVIQAATLPFGSITWIHASTDLSKPSTTQGANRPQVAVDCKGNAVAVWQLTDFSNNSYVIQAASLSFGLTTWSPCVNLRSPFARDPNISPFPKIAADLFGNDIAVWEVYDPNNQTSVVQAAILPYNSTSWGEAKTISTVISNTIRFHLYPAVSIGGNGMAVSVWDLYDAAPYNIRSATIQLPVPTIQQFSGRVQKNRFLTQTEYAHLLSWDKGEVPCVVCYRIYCGNQVVATLPGNATQVCLHNCTKNLPCYKLIAYDACGNALASAIVNK